MRESLFSPLWHRFSQQRPRLRSHVSVQQQQYRNRTWYLLTNATNGNHYRINQVAYQFVGRCDGQHSVQAVWDSLLESLGDEAPTQDEIISLLNELDQRDLIRYEALPNIKGMFRRKKEKSKQQRRAAINPFSMRLPLWDPSSFVSRLHWLGALVFNPLTLLLWLGAVGSALLSASAHWAEISAHFASHMSTPRYLFMAWLAFPFVKALHELGHALAVHRWGGQVRETGVTLFMLTPAPYVDASAASVFRRTHQRIVVGAIGMMVELLIASAALWIWFSAQPGIIQDVAFVVMFICSVSTVLFNGNPLLRFDAYYIFCDTFDLPNLATRSRTFWVNLLKRLVLGSRGVAPFEMAPGEAKWLFFYAPISYLFTLSIMSYAVLWLGSKSFVIGVLGALFILIVLVVIPAGRLINNILDTAPLGTARLRAKFLIALALVGSVSAFFLIPAPFVSTAQGVVWIPDEAQIRPEVEGFVREIHVRHGELVEPGQVLVELEDNELTADHAKLSKQVESMQADQFNLVFQDPARAMEMVGKIDKTKAELQRLEQKLGGLMIRSQAKGTLVMPHQDDLPGTFVKKGQLLGYVLNQNAISVRVAVPEPDAALLRERNSRILVRTADHPNEEVIGEVGADSNSVTRALPSAALADINGGRYPTDPEDKEGMTTVEPVVLMDIVLPTVMLERSGVRATVRFEHGSEPLAQQAYRRLRQLFLRYFAASD